METPVVARNPTSGVRTADLPKTDSARRVSSVDRRETVGHRLEVIGWMIVLTTGIYWLQNLLWEAPNTPESLWGYVWQWSSLVWLLAVIPAAPTLVGLLMYQRRDTSQPAEGIPNHVVFRIVSRGDNSAALAATVRRCWEEMSRTPLFDYTIEVVTDAPNRPVFDVPNVRSIEVPEDYQTPKRSKFKARALHYALQHSPAAATDWLVHLDEETHPTPSVVRGIADMVAEEEESGELRIGQGAIAYHRTFRDHPFLTLADSIRTGDDLGRFYLQHHSIGIAIFGLHGSFVVCRNDVEAEVGFDVGPEGSITEDAFWALEAMQGGRRSRWCEGFMEEQSTRSCDDFMKQRRRWWQGIVNVVRFAPVKMRFRFILGISLLAWTAAPVSIAYTYLNFLVVDSFSTPSPIRLACNLTLATFATSYQIGLRENMRLHGGLRRLSRIGLYILQLLLVPVFGILEAGGVVMGMLRPESGFHVVKK